MVFEEESEPPAIVSEKNKKINKVLNIYKELGQNPNLIDARIISIARNGINVQSFWQQRNMERVIKQKFTQEFGLDADLQMVCESFPIDVGNEIMCIQTENEKLKAILREVPGENKEKNQFIELWDRQHLIKSYDLNQYKDIHGPVYTDPHFSSFQWSPGNSHIIYLAQRKAPKYEPFYKQRSHKYKPDPEALRGEEHKFVPDWGEKMVGYKNSVIVILNTEDDTIRTQDFLPPEYFPAQVMWTPNGDYIVGICYKIDKHRNMGLAACTNRESNVFLLKNTDFKKLTPDGKHCTAPQFSPDGEQLIWLEREIGPGSAHHQCHRLMRVKWGTDETNDVIIDYVPTSIDTKNGKKFYGFYNYSIPKRCWTHDSKFLFVSTPQRSRVKSYLVNVETKDLYEIENPDESSLVVLDVRKNRVAFLKTSLTKPPQLTVGKFEPGSSNIANVNLVNVTEPLCNAGMDNLMFEHNDFVYNTNDPIKDFNFTYFGPKSGDEHKVPLIVVPHGGPHSAFSNSFVMEFAIYARLGFAILIINYRGSTGMGADNVDFLLGRVGETDVFDCVTAINASLKKYTWLDPSRVVLRGGSHGGFLSAHLSAQHPNMFRAVVLLNPVIDLAAMITVTDIPDWCAAETGTPFLEKLPPASKETKYAEIVMKMYNHSPVLLSDKVKAPTLILLGSEDLRVPMSQGKIWYNRLVANKVETRLYVYPDNHSLAKDHVELDRIINTSLWLQRQMIDKADREEEEEEIGGIAISKRGAPKTPEPPKEA